VSEPGHLFIVDADLTKLACDAWLLPTDRRFRISESFRGAVKPALPEWLEDRKWAGGESFQPYHPDRDLAVPWMWLGDIGRDRDTPPSFFAERAADFVRKVGPKVKECPSGGRDRALLAVNLLGSGDGGKASERLALCDAIIPALIGAARDAGVDVVLVAWGREPYSAAQRARQNLLAGPDASLTAESGWDLGPQFDALEQSAKEIAAAVRAESLVLFMGAGVSVNAGIPAWGELLHSIAKQANFAEQELEAMAKHDFRDQAALLERQIGADPLRSAVRQRMTATGYSLTHALLASLNVREAVTTNYDSLYERAVGNRDGGVTVLPADRVEPGRPWLLKLHGSTDDGDIVLTRDDYRAVNERRGALLGLLQAMLLTRTMLFVGYSLSDEDFHAVMSDVRRVIGDRHVGTALSLAEDRLFEELWDPHLKVLPMTSNMENAALPAAARTLQIFLDLVAAHAADLSSFLLAEGYDEAGVLTDSESTFRAALIELERHLPPSSDLPSAQRVRQLLATFGAEAHRHLP
jgi:hypothetical protein